MNTRFSTDEKLATVWREFIQQEGLTTKQEEKFLRYFDMLLTWNEAMDLTAITKPADIIAYHFQDSLYIDRFIDFTTVNSFIDVGTGAGFPAIPLMIKYPKLVGNLIEVSKKRLSFLENVIKDLDLSHATLYDFDWRTFLRKTSLDSSLVVARASLHTDELLRMFKPSSPCKNATLVYWASKEWQISDQDKLFFQKEENYTIKSKKRRYIFFAKKP